MQHVIALASILIGAASIAPAATHPVDVVWSGGVAVDGINGAGRADPDNALGASDGRFLSLGLGGWAVFDFGAPIAGDVSAMEVSYGCRLALSGFCRGYDEAVEVLAANSFNGVDLNGFAAQGVLRNGAAQAGERVTLAPGAWRWLALRDISPQRAGRDGFDIDSVTATLAPTPVNLPATGWLMLGGCAAALGAARRR